MARQVTDNPVSQAEHKLCTRRTKPSGKFVDGFATFDCFENLDALDIDDRNR